jgi:ubiquinone/menaquinone biosynthesis C-methylase UbiE
MPVDENKINELLGAFVGDLGATVSAGSIVIGDKLGIYRALAKGPATAEELAKRVGADARYLTEWARGQAASGYITYDPATDAFSLTPEQEFVMTDPNGPAYLPGAFQIALGALAAVPRITESFRTGAGMGWAEQNEDVFVGCERFFRPGYLANLTSSWIPALDGVEAKLRAGASVADIGCGHGASTVLMAQAYPNSTFSGSDYHQGSIDEARKRAADAGVADRVAFETANSTSFSGTGYDLTATFDCLHDMGDPVAAARHVREALKPDGTWLVVEPYAQDDPADNLNPVGRVYYSFSTLLCVPNAKSQGGHRTLGAQAGEAAIREVTAEAGFTRFRRAAETPFNLVYEVRP